MESGLALLTVAMPLLAVQFGASWMLLGTIGWVAQIVRTPVCFTAGPLSEKVGRAKLIIPAACICGASIAALSFARTNTHIIILYTIAMASIGAFYPSLQALIGDVSERGQLRKNIGMFNVGWCVGGATAALIGRWLVAIGLSKVFIIGGISSAFAAVLVLTWPHKPAAHTPENQDTESATGEDYGPLLLISRMGHFTGFFGASVIRVLFPKLALETLHWSQSTVVTSVALLLWGLGIGILIINISPWWRSKLWPQIAAQAIMMISSLGVLFSSSPYILSALFFGFGVAHSVAYTGALYYGLSSRKGRGMNTGIHEGLVAAGSVLGCLLGGIVAQHIAMIAPFVLLSALAGCCIPVSAVLWAKRQVREREY